MPAKALSAALAGVEGLVVEVEVDIGPGLPAFNMVGLAEGAVREARERVRAAIRNCGYTFPQQRITVNLAPADLPKAGTAYDLPIALGILAASEHLPAQALEGVLICGELSLDAAVRPVPGLLSMALAAREAGLSRMLAPRRNAGEAAVVRGLEVLGVESVHQAVDLLRGAAPARPVRLDIEALFKARSRGWADLADVKGQEHARRALEVAAAGGHNILLRGVPGTGKTMLARRLPGILPPMDLDEAVETTRIYSTAGMMPPGRALLTTRPFRAPHHTISDAGLIGGGATPRPGEVSLAHNGVLFLDELPEFRRHVLEVLRQPLEDREVTISRAALSLRFPARFMLVAAMNPCPCGYLGDSVRQCSCSRQALDRYLSRLSGPLLDRIDMHVEVPPVTYRDLGPAHTGECSARVRERVVAAREIQRQRFAALPGALCNSDMRPAQVEHFCILEPGAAALLEQAMERLGLSARVYHRILKIARTIADLDGGGPIVAAHVAEAVGYRRPVE